MWALHEDIVSLLHLQSGCPLSNQAAFPVRPGKTTDPCVQENSKYDIEGFGGGIASVLPCILYLFS